MVILELTIGCRGEVTDVAVLKGLPLGLTEAAVAAAYRWRWEPATRNGVAVAVLYNVTINFGLQ